MENKSGIALSFNWIFALIVGGFILFVAIYATTRIVDIGSTAGTTTSAAKLISLFDPFETGLASGKSKEIVFSKEVKTIFTCEERANLPFGKQTVSYIEKTLGREKESEPVTIANKYIFSEQEVSGKKFYVFSKPFKIPFKVADIIIVNSNEYCFYNAPIKIKEGIEKLSIKDINFTDDFDLCKDMGVMVCFERIRGCDIEVNEDAGYVYKNDEELYYIDNTDGEPSLIYGAIFSDPEIYKCNVKRLIRKFSELSLIYIEKTSILNERGCSSNIDAKLRIARDVAGNSSSLRGVKDLAFNANEIDQVNEGARNGCEVY